MSDLRRGCGDNSCKLVRTTGQGTNGGCRCLDELEALRQFRDDVVTAEVFKNGRTRRPVATRSTSDEVIAYYTERAAAIRQREEVKP